MMSSERRGFRSGRAREAILTALLDAPKDVVAGVKSELGLGRDWLRSTSATLPVEADASAGVDGWVLLAKDHDTSANYDVPAAARDADGAEVGVVMTTEFRGRDLWGLLVWRRPDDTGDAFDARCRKVQLDHLIASVKQRYGVQDAPAGSVET